MAIYPFHVTYDIECYFQKGNSLPASTDTTGYTSIHHLLSVSVNSNVPGYTDPVCYVREEKEDVVTTKEIAPTTYQARWTICRLTTKCQVAKIRMAKS